MMCSYPRTAQHRATFRRFSTFSSSQVCCSPASSSPSSTRITCCTSSGVTIVWLDIVSSREAASLIAHQSMRSARRLGDNDRGRTVNEAIPDAAIVKRLNRRADERRVCYLCAYNYRLKKRSRSVTCFMYDAHDDNSRR